MAIIFPLTIPPEVKITRFSFELISNNTVFRSPISNMIQVLARPGALWGGVFTLAPIKTIDSNAVKAFLVSLSGEKGSFWGFDPSHRTPSGIASTGAGDTPTVAGAGQIGNSINTTGWRINQTGLLLPGDYFQFSKQLKMVLESVDSDGLGESAITFEPPITKSPPDTQTVVFDNPVGEFRLEDSNQTRWDARPPDFHNFSFSIVEVPEI